MDHYNLKLYQLFCSITRGTYLVSNVMDGDVMHGCGVTLKQSMQVSSTVSETEDRHVVYISLSLMKSYTTSMVFCHVLKFLVYVLKIKRFGKPKRNDL